MKVRALIALASLVVISAAGCKQKPPDLSDVPPLKPPPGYSPPSTTPPGGAPGTKTPGPKPPAPPVKGK